MRHYQVHSSIDRTIAVPSQLIGDSPHHQRLTPSTVPIPSLARHKRFGEVAHAPPDLTKIPKPRGFKDQGQSKSWARHNGGRGGDNDNEGRQQSGKKRGGGGAVGGGGVTVAKGEEEEEGEDVAEKRKAQNRQMEEMRKRVQEAYSGLKKKRRAGQTQFVGSDL